MTLTVPAAEALIAVKTCPACLSDDLPAAATKCKYCATDQPALSAT